MTGGPPKFYTSWGKIIFCINALILWFQTVNKAAVFSFLVFPSAAKCPFKNCVTSQTLSAVLVPLLETVTELADGSFSFNLSFNHYLRKFSSPCGFHSAGEKPAAAAFSLLGAKIKEFNSVL